ncbi:MAG: hypothetical protein R3E95_17075 [Thiolinea sp.]
MLGGMLVNRADIHQLLARYRSPKAFAYTLALVLRYGRDKLLHGRAAHGDGQRPDPRLLASARKLGSTWL